MSLPSPRRNPQIEVGTISSVPGPGNFDTVVFDLVEDGQRSRSTSGDGLRTAALGGTPRQASGLRMVNVGITRAKRRLYLIRESPRRDGARPARVRCGAVQAPAPVPARSMLSGRWLTSSACSKAPADDPVAGETSGRRCGGTRLIVDLYDEDHLPDELCRRIDEAHERIWLWSPWVGRRSEQMLPHLTRAQDRGVRVHAVVLPRSEVTRYLKPRT